MTLLHRVTLAGLATCLCLAAFPAAAQTASAALKTADGKDAGTVKLAQVPGGVLLTLSVKGLPPKRPAKAAPRLRSRPRSTR